MSRILPYLCHILNAVALPGLPFTFCVAKDRFFKFFVKTLKEKHPF